MILLKVRELAMKSHLGIILCFCFLFFSCSKDRAAIKAAKDANDKLIASKSARIASYSSTDLFRGIMFMSGAAAAELPEIQEQVQLIRILNPTAENQENLTRMQNNFIHQIEEQYPGYIDSFAETIRSDDHERIREELTRAQDIIFATVSKYFRFETGTATSAREQVLELFKNKQEEIEDLVTKLQFEEISKEDFETRIMSTLNLDETQLRALAESAGTDPDSNLFGGCVAFLSFVGCNVAVAINIAGYVNIALAAAVAVAAAAWVFTYKWKWNGGPTKAFTELDYEKYIDRIVITF